MGDSEMVTKGVCNERYDRVKTDSERAERRLNEHSKRVTTIEEAVIRLTTMVEDVQRRATDYSTRINDVEDVIIRLTTVTESMEERAKEQEKHKYNMKLIRIQVYFTSLTSLAVGVLLFIITIKLWG